jgi:protocatechuate 3,4-dioxygenase beta subunit
MPPASPKKSSRQPILIGLLAIVVLGLVTWFFVGNRDSSNRGSAETSETKSGTKPKSPSRSIEDSAAVNTASASGQVRSKSDASLEGARVTLLPLAREGESAEPIDVACDDQGRWSIAALAPGRYAISASAPNHLPAWRPELRVSAGAELTGLDLVLEPGGSKLAGTVRDLTGGEIEAARIQLTPVGGLSRLRERESFFALTDAEGRYAVQVPEGRFRVQASHADYTRAQAVLDLGAGAHTHDFELVPMGVIEGVVVRASDSSPVAAASVTWSREVTQVRPSGERATELERGGTVTTDGEGRFRIRGLLPGTVLIHARAPGLASDAPTPIPIAIAEHVEGVEIRVGTAADVRGRVVAADDASSGIAGTQIELIAPVGPGATATADGEGRFVIHGVQPGGYELLASAEGWLPKLPPMRVSVTLDPSEETEEIMVALERGLAIRGRVEPATSAEISIELTPRRMERGGGMGMGMRTMMMSTASATSEPEQGSFELSPVQPGIYTLVAKAADGRGGSVEVEVGATGADDVVIRLEPRAKLAGTVRDSQGKPVAGASVLARKQQPSNANMRVVVNGRELTASHAPTSDEGLYELLGLDAGTWTLEVIDAQGDPLAWADGSRKPLSVELRAAEVREGFDLAVEARDGVITGTVRYAEGQPVADAWVSATFVPGLPEHAAEPAPDDGEPRSEMTMVVATDTGLSGASAMLPTLTDGQGRFRFEGLRRGPHRLVAESTGEGGGIAKVTLESVIPDADVVMKLAPLGTIEGKVTGDPDEDCIARDCIVRISGPSGRSAKVHDGHFELARLDPGSYAIDLETSTGGAHVEVEVEAGETASVELTIQRFSRVRGRILDDADQPVVGAEILIGDSPEEGMVQITQDGSKEPIVTDAEGRFDVAVGPGSRVVLAIDMSNPRPLAMKRFVAESGKDIDLGDLRPPTGGPGFGPPEGAP